MASSDEQGRKPGSCTGDGPRLSAGFRSFSLETAVGRPPGCAALVLVGAFTRPPSSLAARVHLKLEGLPVLRSAQLPFPGSVVGSAEPVPTQARSRRKIGIPPRSGTGALRLTDPRGRTSLSRWFFARCKRRVDPIRPTPVLGRRRSFCKDLISVSLVAGNELIRKSLFPKRSRWGSADGIDGSRPGSAHASNGAPHPGLIRRPAYVRDVAGSRFCCLPSVESAL